MSVYQSTSSSIITAVWILLSTMNLKASMWLLQLPKYGLGRMAFAEPPGIAFSLISSPLTAETTFVILMSTLLAIKDIASWRSVLESREIKMIASNPKVEFRAACTALELRVNTRRSENNRLLNNRHVHNSRMDASNTRVKTR